MRKPEVRPAAGAAAAAADGAAVVDGAAVADGAGEVDAAAVAGGAGEVDAALDLIAQGLGRLAEVDATTLPERCVTATVRRLGALDGRIDGIQARFVAAAEAAGVPERSGAASTTSWLAQETGRTGGQAARTSRLARTAETSPELTDAVAAGEVGPDHANTIATGLDRGELEPEDVDELLPVARRQSPGMFSRHTRELAGRRRQERLRDQELVARAERSHRQWRTPNGSLRYEGLLPPAEGDLMEKGIAGFYQPDSKDVPDDQRRTHEQRSADAMAGLLEAALRSGEAGDVGGTRPHINLVTPVEAMAALRDAEQAGITAVTDIGTVLSAAAFTKLACDASVRRVVVDADSRPLDVGRATRDWPAPMRAAIAAIDGGCRGPGCDLPPHRSIIHHIRWWEQGGETSTDNGVMLCGHHHDFVHDDGWTVTMDPATRRCTWTPPGADAADANDADDAVIVTEAWGPAARGHSPTLQPPHEGPPEQATVPQPADTVPATAANAHARRGGPPGRPSGRGDPGRPRSPGSDPPRRDRADADPPASGEPEPLRLEL